MHHTPLKVDVFVWVEHKLARGPPDRHKLHVGGEPWVHQLDNPAVHPLLDHVRLVKLDQALRNL